MIGISSYASHDLPLPVALENIERIPGCAEIYSEGLHDLFRNPEVPLSYDLKYSVHAPQHRPEYRQHPGAYTAGEP